MKTILLAIFFSVSALAQVNFSNFVVDGISYSSARISWNTDVAATYNNIEWDTQPTPPLAYRGYPKKDSATVHGKTVSSLPSNSTIYYRAYGTSGGTVYYSAVSSFVTAPAPADPFAAPTLPAEDAVPNITTSARDYTVSACTALPGTIATAAAAGLTGNVRILIDPSLDCTYTTAFLLPTNTNTGYLQIRSGAPDSALPPPGVRITPDWKASMPKIRDGVYNVLSIAGPLFQLNTTGKSRYVFGPGLYFSEAWPAPSAYVKNITAVTAGSPITYTVPAHGFVNNNILQIREVGGVTGANVTNCKVINATTDTFQCKNSTGTGTYTSGGWVVNSANQPWLNYFIVAFVNATQNVIDRCIFTVEHAPPVSIYNDAVHASSAGSMIVANSYFSNINHWRGVDPDSPTTTYGLNSTAIAIDLTQCQKCKVENNYVNVPGISIFAQGADGTVCASDIVIRRNLSEWDPQWWWQGPSTNGLYAITRQSLEFKNCNRCLIEGNSLRNDWNTGQTGNLSYQNFMVAVVADSANISTSVNQVSNITHRYNSIYNSAGSFTVRGKNYSPSDLVLGRSHLYRDNLVYNINPFYYTIPGWGSYSPFIYISDTVEGMTVEHNTTYDIRGNGPSVLYMVDTDPGADLRVRNNLFVLQNSNPSGFKGVDYLQDQAAQTPPLNPLPVTTNNLTVGNSLWGSNGHTFDFSYNVVVPGAKDSSSAANYDVTSGAAYLDLATAQSYWSVLPRTTLIGSAGESANQRAARVKFLNPAAADFRLRHDSPVASSQRVTSDGKDAGADINAVEAAQGKVRNVRVVSVDRTSAVIGYTRPADTVCTVEYGTQTAMGTGQRSSDSGPIGANTTYVPVTVTLSGLQPAVTYNYRVLCPVEQPSGQFITLP